MTCRLLLTATCCLMSLVTQTYINLEMTLRWMLSFLNTSRHHEKKAAVNKRCFFDVEKQMQQVGWSKMVNTSKNCENFSIEHSKNKIIRCFSEEVGPGVLHSNVQETRTLHEFHTERTELRSSQWLMLCAFSIFAAFVFTERSTGALQVRSSFSGSPNLVIILFSECSIRLKCCDFGRL